jgi:hypothetical protein
MVRQNSVQLWNQELTGRLFVLADVLDVMWFDDLPEGGSWGPRVVPSCIRSMSAPLIHYRSNN